MKYTICYNIICDSYEACKLDKLSLSRSSLDVYRLNCAARKRYNRLVQAKNKLEAVGQIYASMLPEAWDREHDKFHKRGQSKN